MHDLADHRNKPKPEPTRTQATSSNQAFLPKKRTAARSLKASQCHRRLDPFGTGPATAAVLDALTTTVQPTSLLAFLGPLGPLGSGFFLLAGQEGV